MSPLKMTTGFGTEQDIAQENCAGAKENGTGAQENCAEELRRCTG
jgi:hypothetical protein